MAEPFRLWAIEGDDEVKRKLSFAEADAGMVITPNIEQYKELKLRLLNGTHTFCCGPAFLSGMGITRNATLDKDFAPFMRRLMEEISASIPLEIDAATRQTYAAQVLERFANPSIDHQWINITLQYSSKMRMRNLPLLETWYKRYNTVPPMMATGFAGYLYFMKGVYNGNEYTIKDDKSELFRHWWTTLNTDELVDAALSSEALWGRDLRELPGFRDAVARILMGMLAQGVFETLKQMTAR
jgi:tagaturonate reductase